MKPYINSIDTVFIPKADQETHNMGVNSNYS